MRLNLSKRGGFLEHKWELLTKRVTESNQGGSCKDMEGIWKSQQGIARKKIKISSKSTIPGKARTNHQEANKAFLQSKSGTPPRELRELPYMQQSSIAMRNCWKAEQQVGNIPRKWIGKGDMGVSQRPGGKHNKSGKFLGCDVLEIKLV